MKQERVYDYLIIGSGFGGSIAAMRLAEKGYDVLVVERGRRYADKDFARSDWNIWRHLWMPALRCFGIWQDTLLNGIMILHGSGVGGGSLVYANVLMKPDDQLFAADQWRHLADWKTLLQPHFATARRMLGVAKNPRQTKADETLREIARELGRSGTFRPTEVATLLGDPTKARQKLDWTPETSFEAMVHEMVAHDLVDASREEVCRRKGFEIPNSFEANM